MTFWTMGFSSIPIHRLVRQTASFLAVALGFSAGVAGAGAEDTWRYLDRWSFQGGIAFITANTIDDIFVGRVNIAGGDPGGQIYLLQGSYTLRDLEWNFWGRRWQPQLELPIVLGLVDEGGRSPFGQYSSGVTVRWKDFPWNKYLYTNFETGVGLTYSDRIVAIQRHRHPARERSKLEFYWPIQLTFAHPRHRQHQMVLFMHHHSGGRLFHRGGANHLGIGYRWVPRERASR